jgi:hypothetical protein
VTFVVDTIVYVRVEGAAAGTEGRGLTMTGIELLLVPPALVALTK